MMRKSPLEDSSGRERRADVQLYLSALLLRRQGWESGSGPGLAAAGAYTNRR